MSVRVIAWVYDQKVGDYVAKAVLGKLADNANDEGVSWPSIGRLSEDTEIPERTVKRKIRFLLDAGWISVRPQRAGGQFRSNVYQVSVPWATVAHGSTTAPWATGGKHRGPPRARGENQPSLEPSTAAREGARTREAVQEAGAQRLVAVYCDAVVALGSPAPRRLVGMVAKQVGELVDDGLAPEVIERALELLVSKRLHPSTLPTLVPEAVAGVPERSRFGRGMTTDQILAKYRVAT